MSRPTGHHSLQLRHRFVTALAAGLWPALRMRTVAPSLDLKQGSYSVSGKMTRMDRSVQIAISVTLLVSALLLGSTFAHLYMEPSGFRGRISFSPTWISRTQNCSAQSKQAAELALAELQAEPESRAPRLCQCSFARHDFEYAYFSIDRHGVKHSDPKCGWRHLSGYFETMGTKILEGRALTPADEMGDKVCVLSRSAAEFFFPGEDAIGRVVYPGNGNASQDAQVIDPKNERRVVASPRMRTSFLAKQPDHILYGRKSAAI